MASKRKKGSETASTDQSCAVPIVFVHGIKGTSLVNNANGHVEYGSVEGFLNLVSGNVDQPPRIDPDTNHQVRDNLSVGNLIGYVSFFGIGIAKVMGPFLAMAKEKATARGSDFHTFVYDWRREVSEHVDAFDKWLVKLVNENGYHRGVQLVAHSMGAVVTIPALAKHPELFHSIAWVAPAFGTGLSFIEDSSLMGKYSGFRQHNNTGLNSTLITPTTWATCPSGYSFFPTKEHPTSHCSNYPHMVNPEGKPLEFDFYNLADYKKYRLGIYHPKSGVAVTPELETFLSEMLVRNHRFRRNLEQTVIKHSPPQRVLLSICGKCPVQYVIDQSNASDPIQWDKTTFISGDGRLSTKQCSNPPYGLKVSEVVSSTNGHMQVLSDIPKISLMLDKLLADGDRAFEAKHLLKSTKRPRFR